MLTASTTDNFVLTNLGPLTTVFTAPSSCATPEPLIQLGPSSDFGALLFSNCNATTYSASIATECYPSGSKLSSLGVFIGTLAYYSPGLVCPSAWTTVGVAVKDASGSISSNGLFAPFTTGVPGGPILDEPAPNILMNALAKQETAAVCCPSGYKYNLNDNACTSNQPRSMFSASIACNYFYSPDFTTRTLDYFGTTKTIELPEISTSISLYKSVTTLNSTVGTAVGLVNAVTLVHAATTTSRSSSTATSSSASSTKTSASKQMRLGAGSSLGTVLACWTVAALAGVAIMAVF